MATRDIPRPVGRKAPAGDDQLSISISGDPATVARMIAALAGTFSGEIADAPAPEKLFLSRSEAARRSGIGEERLGNLVKLGKLTNHGTPGKLLLSLAEIRALADR